MNSVMLKAAADAVEAGQRHPVHYEAEALRALANALDTDIDHIISRGQRLQHAQVFATLHAANMTAHLADITDGKL